MPSPEHPMLPYLVDLEHRFDFNAFRPYDPVERIRYALGTSDYWADLALRWLEEGVPAARLVDELLSFEAQAGRRRSVIEHGTYDRTRRPRAHMPRSALLCRGAAATLLRMERFDVQADAQLDDDNVMLTLSGASWLLNVNASPAEWTAGLPRVPDADHAHRLDVNLGTSARHPVWWSVSDGQLTLSVGQDVESGDFVVVLPAALLSDIQAQLDNVRGDDWG